MLLHCLMCMLFFLLFDVQLEKSPKLGLHVMEDEEGEVMEHKPISHSLSRNESKRILVRPPSAECSTSSSAYLGGCPVGKGLMILVM